MNKAGYAAIGIGVVIAIIGIAYGLSLNQEMNEEEIAVEEEATPIETAPPEGVSIEINLSDSVEGKGNP